MESAIRDIKLAGRLLLKQPGFSLVAVLTLGLGIGGSTAIFSVVDATLLRPLPYANPERMVRILVELRRPDGRVVRLGPSVEDVRDWQQHSQVFSHLGMWRSYRPAVLDGPEPERVEIRHLSEGYLGVFGVTPLLGRGIQPDDVRQGVPAVVLLGYGFWQSRFGGDQGVIGRVLRLDNEPATIVGVLPARFHGDSKIWRPLQMSNQITQRGTGVATYGRLRPGIDIDQAQRTIGDLTARLDQERVRPDGTTVNVTSLYDWTTAGYHTTANVLAAAVGSILLIACVNVAGLLLARGAARLPELAIRASIGAGRGRLVRQLLTESLVLSAAGGAVGLLIAWASLDALVANIPMSLPSNSPVTLNPQVLAFAVALSLATGLAFGLAPAVTLSRVSVTNALAHAGRRHGSALSRRGGQLLIGVEVALALVLLAGAGLMIRSFARVLTVDVGFDPASVITMEVVPVNPNAASLEQYYPALVKSLRDHAAVEAVGAVDHLPLSASSTKTVAVVEGEKVPVNIREFLPGYFEAIGFRLKSGRFPAESDRTAVRSGAMLNEQAARQMFPGGPAIGRRFEVLDASFEVLGVVGDLRHWGPLRPAEPEVYLSFGYREPRPMIVVVRPRGLAPALREQLRQAAGAMGTRIVVDRIRRGSDWFDDRIVTPRQRTVLLALLGGLGLLLALVGVFGMTAYAVARTTQEIGVRMAFGARPGDVVRAMVADAARPVAIGILFGLGGATAATRVIASFLFDTPPTDPLTFAAVAGTLAVAACLAAWVPARRAGCVDPVAALRAE